MEQLKKVLLNADFWTAVGSALFMVIVAVEPRFEGSRDLIISSFLLIVMGLITKRGLTEIALGWLSQPGNIAVAIEAAQAAVDAGENFLKIDIPDSMEAAAREELRKVLQRLVDEAKAPPVEINIGGAVG